MLRLGLTAALLVCACSIDNPFFGLISAGGPETGDEATAGATTAVTTPSEGGETTTTSEGGESATTDPVTMPTTSPDTEATLATTEEPSGSSSTGEPPYVCEVEYNPTPTRVVRDYEFGGGPWTNCEKEPVPQKLKGYVQMKGGVLRFSPDINCADPGDGSFKFEFGSGYEAPDREFCGLFTMYWTDAAECTIAALSVQEIENDNPQQAIYAVYYGPTDAGPGFPYAPLVPLAGSCGCEEVEAGCCEYDPGYRDLKLDEVSVPPGAAKEVPSKGVKFFNYNATVEPSCQTTDVLVMRLEWFAYALQ